MTYQVVATIPAKLLSGANSTLSTLIQFDIWAESYLATKQVFAVLQRLFDGFSGTLPDGSSVLFSELDSAHDLFEAEARLYRLSADFRFITTTKET